MSTFSHMEQRSYISILQTLLFPYVPPLSPFFVPFSLSPRCSRLEEARQCVLFRVDVI